MKSLAIVGTGITTFSHITEEAKGYIATFDKVLYLVNEPLLKEYIKKNSRNSEDLSDIYFRSPERMDSYEDIASKLLFELENRDNLCLVIYGHPYFFSTPSFLALEKAECEGIKTIVCPAVSSIDCLYSDLRLDPANNGVQILDATEYILYEKNIDTTSNFIICQIGMVGNKRVPGGTINLGALKFLKKKLINIYNPEKKLIIYEAALYPKMEPIIIEFKLTDLDIQKLTPISTLYIPPVKTDNIPNPQALKLIK